MIYDPRKCAVCGKEYIPTRSNQKTCLSEECIHENRRRTQLLYAKRRREELLARKRRYMAGKRSDPKHDTIIAIGYAERQIARSLELAGKVRTEL